MSPQSQSSFIGIELSGSKLRGATVDSEGAIMKRAEADINGGGLVAQLTTMVAELRAGDENVAGVGIAIPGLVNRQNDRVIASSFLPSTVSNN
jgi:predicted NBD/HSP70 family sugar kinase